MATFNIAKAKAAGKTDEEIQAFLASRPDLEVSTNEPTGFTKGGAKEPIPMDVYNEAGAKPLDLQVGFDLPFQAADIAGEKGAEFAAKKGINPTLAAASGTAIQMIPDALLAAKAVKPLAKGAELVKSIGKNLIKGPNAEEIAAAQQTLKELPIKLRQKTAILEELDKAARKGIGIAEEKAGLSMKEIPQVPKDVTGFANEMKVYSQYTPEQLKEVIPVERLQELKKIAQVAKRGNILPEEQAFINQGVEKIDQAIAQTNPEIGQELSKFREIQDSLKSLPEETKAKKETLTALINKLKTEAKGSTSGKVRNLIGTALRYGAIGGGLGGIHRLLK